MDPGVGPGRLLTSAWCQKAAGDPPTHLPRPPGQTGATAWAPSKGFTDRAFLRRPTCRGWVAQLVLPSEGPKTTLSLCQAPWFPPRDSLPTRETCTLHIHS